MTIWILRTIVGHPMSISRSLRWASMERQWFRIWPIQQSQCCIVKSIHTGSIDYLFNSKGKRQDTCHILEINVNGMSTTSGLESWTITGFCSCINPWLQQWVPQCAKLLPMISPQPPNNEHQWRVNNFMSCIMDSEMALQRCNPIIKILAAYMGKKQVMISLLPPENDSRQSVYDFW